MQQELISPELIYHEVPRQEPSLEQRKITYFELVAGIKGLIKAGKEVKIVHPTKSDPYLMVEGKLVLGWI